MGTSYVWVTGLKCRAGHDLELQSRVRADYCGFPAEEVPLDVAKDLRDNPDTCSRCYHTNPEGHEKPMVGDATRYRLKFTAHYRSVCATCGYPNQRGCNKVVYVEVEELPALPPCLHCNGSGWNCLKLAPEGQDCGGSGRLKQPKEHFRDDGPILQRGGMIEGGEVRVAELPGATVAEWAAAPKPETCEDCKRPNTPPMAHSGKVGDCDRKWVFHGIRGRLSAEVDCLRVALAAARIRAMDAEQVRDVLGALMPNTIEAWEDERDRIADMIAEMARAEIDNAASSDDFDDRSFAEQCSRALRRAEAKVRAMDLSRRKP